MHLFTTEFVPGIIAQIGFSKNYIIIKQIDKSKKLPQIFYHPQLL